jgi:hypothetical protein
MSCGNASVSEYRFAIDGVISQHRVVAFTNSRDCGTRNLTMGL